MGNDNEKDKDFAVNDKRKFSMDEDGNVTKKEQTESEEKPGKDYFNGCESNEDFANLPPINFMTLVFSLSTQAMISLGEMPDPVSHQSDKNLAIAKQTIDLLGILEEKTHGNLTSEEERFLKTSLTDLRVRFVNSCQD